MILAFSIFILLLLTAASAFCSSSETAYFSLPMSRVQQWRHSPVRQQRFVSQLLGSSRQLLVLIFLLNTIVNIVLQNVASNLFDDDSSFWFLKVGIPLALILIFGEFLPKYFGMLHNETLALTSAPFFLAAEKIFSPLQRVITSIAEAFTRLFFFFLRPAHPLSQDEIETLIDTGTSQKLLSQEEASLLRGALDLEWKPVRELMSPKHLLPTIQKSHLSDIARVTKVASRHHTLLIIEADINYPIGALDGYGVLLVQKGAIVKALHHARQKLFFAPETMSSRKLLQEFTIRNASLACIVDEHGTLSGYLTWEDLVRVFLKAYKNAENTPSIETVAAMTFEGSTPISTINKIFNTSLKSTYQSTTIGGWLTEMLDGIPPPGTTYVTDNLVFRVIASHDRAVQQVFIQPHRRE
jgi:CBS domain containing-hemolysin-like protein